MAKSENITRQAENAPDLVSRSSNYAPDILESPRFGSQIDR